MAAINITSTIIIILQFLLLSTNSSIPPPFTILKCFESIDATHLEQYPIIQFNDKKYRNRSGEITQNGLLITTQNISRNDILKFGYPSCVIYTAFDETTVYTWFGAVSQNVLPFECYTNNTQPYPPKSSSMTCIDNVPFPYSPIKQNGLLCCCTHNKCNFRHPTYYAKLRNKQTSMLMSFARFWFALIIVIYFMMIFTYILVTIKRLVKKLNCRKRSNRFDDLDSYEPREITKMHLLSLENTQDVEEVPEMEKARNEPTKVDENEPPMRTAEVTQVPDNKTMRIQSVMDKTKTKTKSSLYKSINKKLKPSFLFRNRKRKSENEPVSTDRTQEDDIVPLPPKPQVRVIGNRVQGISMNYDNSTFSDLE
ncbi:unnamed protein product [Caenorhabditis angaria]|uniref:CX domain-containing protein n=1 Tax=Caenorhabditis angaria TaxID=860376 RepID=A0A9P1N2R0_9PELO|nr:unnamed protein product [Caenorhabditis angaria]